MRIIILGGTGLIGYHTTLSLLAHGHQISILSRGSLDAEEIISKDVKSIVGDVFEMNNEELIHLFSNYDAMVYAIGPDDREVPRAPALDFFKKYLVDKCLNICECAKTASIKRIVILNSFFTYFDRIYPEWKLSKHHPYIKCRALQAENCISISNEQLQVMILEIPYVFGTMPNRDPLWKEMLVARLNVMKPWIFFTSGGTAMTTAVYTGKAISGALEYGKSGSYIIGEQNMSWKEMLKIATESLDGFNGRIITIPTFIAQIYAQFEKTINFLKGNEAGLNYPRYIADFQCKFTYFPEELMDITASELHITRGDTKQAIKETFLMCK